MTFLQVNLGFLDFLEEKGKKERMANQEHLVVQVGDQNHVIKDKLAHLAEQDHQALLEREVSRDH